MFSATVGLFIFGIIIMCYGSIGINFFASEKEEDKSLSAGSRVLQIFIGLLLIGASIFFVYLMSL